MISSLTANWTWKLLSLCVAILIWMAVASEPEMATILSVPVQMKNAPRQLEISSAIVSTVKLELSGIRGRLRSLTAAPPSVVLDMTSVRAPGERTFNIDSNSVRLPRGVRLDRAVPAQLRFVFEQQRKKTVPVRIRWTGDLPSGARAIAEPGTLVVVGPESRVNLVDYVSTDPVSVASVADGAVVVTSPFIVEPQVRFTDFHPIRVRVILRD